jgi:hypothetical protein
MRLCGPRPGWPSGWCCTYVVSQGRTAVGYYCLSTGAEKRASVPSKVSRNTPDPVPLILLGLLAVDLNHQGKGIGAGLLKDAFERLAQVSKIVGSRALSCMRLIRTPWRSTSNTGSSNFRTDRRPCSCPSTQSPRASTEPVSVKETAPAWGPSRGCPLDRYAAPGGGAPDYSNSSRNPKVPTVLVRRREGAGHR